MGVTRRDFIKTVSAAFSLLALAPREAFSQDDISASQRPWMNSSSSEDDSEYFYEEADYAELTSMEDEIIRSESVEGESREPNVETFGTNLSDLLDYRGELDKQLQKRRIDTLIVHTTEHLAGPSSRTLENLKLNRSANYFIRPSGAIYEIVPPEQKSNGAGDSYWNGLHEINYNAINIELFANTRKGKYFLPVNDKQYAALASLVNFLNMVFSIDVVLGHNQVAVNYAWDPALGREQKEFESIKEKGPYMFRGRRDDPGRKFEWRKSLTTNPYEIVDEGIVEGLVEMPNITQRYMLPGQRIALEQREAIVTESNIHVLTPSDAIEN